MSHGALLLHGFTATPECLESLAKPLRKNDFDVATPLLAGHGSTVQELANVTWQEWYAGVKTAYEELHKKNDSVMVAGLSLGGLLSLMLASEFPVQRLALLATPIFLSGILSRFVLPLIDHTPLKYIYRYQPKYAGPAINDPEMRAKFKSYSKMPIRSVQEIIKLQKELVPRLSKITVPTLILHSPHDTTAPYENMAYIKEHLGAKKIETVILEKSNHVLTMDYERDLVAAKVLEFFGGGV